VRATADQPPGASILHGRDARSWPSEILPNAAAERAAAPPEPTVAPGGREERVEHEKQVVERRRTGSR
jgi:hypothetical protein